MLTTESTAEASFLSRWMRQRSPEDDDHRRAERPECNQGGDCDADHGCLHAVLVVDSDQQQEGDGNERREKAAVEQKRTEMAHALAPGYGTDST